jgi:hypothetical protein
MGWRVKGMKKSTAFTVTVFLMVASLSVSAQTYPWHEDFDGGLGSEWENGRDAAHLSAPAPGNRPSPACDGGAISSNTCEDSVSRLLDAGGGDLVYYQENWAFGSCRAFSGIRGTVGYPRADGPTCIAELYIISAAPEGGENNGGGAGAFGAWHTNAGIPGWGGSQDAPGTHAALCSGAPPVPGDLEKDMELGTHHWPGWKLTYVDGARGFANCLGTSNPPCPELAVTGGLREISRPSAGALSKPHSLGGMDNIADQAASGSWFQRWELHPIDGGLMQFASTYDPITDTANGGTGWVTVKDTLGTPIDTRNTGGTAGTASTVYLGFGGFKHMGIVQLWVDSLVTPNPVELKWWTLE